MKTHRDMVASTVRDFEKLLPVMKAYIAGKTIQCRCLGREEWSDIGEPHFTHGVEYRVKPEPKVVWIVHVQDKSKPKTYDYHRFSEMEAKNMAAAWPPSMYVVTIRKYVEEV